MPLGETLTCPPGPVGAVATKNIGCSSMKARNRPSIRSCSFMDPILPCARHRARAAGPAAKIAGCSRRIRRDP
ncbi:hypothetical protein Asp14428_15720 [Actinoplanes sp. NBRC 14428]|nr:hypothetical protein Asp14428_15720 [Actinoplanes sp. NBRC 14428]